MLDENAEYNVSAKNAEGKWWSYGTLKKNNYGNLQIGMRVTPELREFVNSKNDGEWLNLSIFAKDKKKAAPSNTAHSQAKGNAYQPEDDQDIPF